MRIAFLFDAIYPHVLGGAEKHVYEVATRLGKRHEVHLLGMKLWEGPETVEVADGVKAHGICAPSPQCIAGQCFTRTMPQVLRYAARIPGGIRKFGPFDIVDCISIPYFPLFTAKLATVLRRIPLTSVWLESWSNDAWREYMGNFKGALGATIEKLSARLPRHFLSISEHTRRGLLRNGVPPERISVITPGLDWKAIQKVRAGESRCDIVFVGRLIKDKGIDLLLDALTMVKESWPSVQCRIVGDGPERASLEERAESLGLNGNVEFTGSVESAYAEIKSALMMVHPSVREGFGITLVEAAACGVPVITVDAPNNASKDLVRQGRFGIVCNADRASLSEAIAVMLGDEDPRHAYGSRGHEWSRRFDWDEVAARFEETYLRVTGEKDAGPS